MRRIILFYAIPAVAIIIALALSISVEPQSVAKKLERSVVHVVVTAPIGSRTGTAFFVNSNGYLVTNLHVIRPHIDFDWDLKVLAKGDPPDKGRPATVVETFPGEDLAVLRVEGLNRPPVVLSRSDADTPATGMTVFALGFPEAGARLGASEEVSFTTGMVSRRFSGSWSEEGPEIPIIQHSAPTNPGSSGGPVVNACGQVVGINTQRELAIFIGPGGLPIMTDIIQGVYFASHSSALAQRLNEIDVAFTSSTKVCRVWFGMASTNFPLMGSVFALLVTILAVVYFVVTPHPIVHIVNGARKVQRSIRGARATRQPARSLPGDAIGTMKTGWRLTGVVTDGGPVEIVFTDEEIRRSDGGIVIGSDPLCDRTLRDPSVSLRHARLVPRGDGVAVTDMHSEKGTMVDGKTVHLGAPPTPLTEGSRLSLGHVTLLVRRV